MADTLTNRNTPQSRPDRSAMLDGMLQCIDELFTRFWEKLEERMMTANGERRSKRLQA
ncbi:Hypothetical predicted protein, partial [Pelobates cultripes]